MVKKNLRQGTTSTLIGGLLLIVSSCGPSEEQRQAERNQIAQAIRDSVNQVQAEQARAEQAEAEAEKQRIADQQKVAINSLLQRDAETLKVSDYTDRAAAMRQLDLTECPPDFSAAYIDHVHAYESYARIRRARAALNSDDNVKGLVFEQLWASITKSDATPIQDAADADARLKELALEASAEITNTFNKVEHIALTYGATLPQR